MSARLTRRSAWRAALIPPVLALLLAPLGCEDEAVVAPVAAPEAVVAPEPEVQAPTYEERRDQLRQAVLGGANPVDGLLALLAERPEDEQLWMFLENSPQDAASAKAWLDRWSSLPESGARAHSLTRAALGLAAGDPELAWSAALEARADSPDAAAAVLARVAQQRKKPEPVEPLVDALIAMAAAPKGGAPAATREAAAQVAGWRAAALRGELLAASGALTEALDEFEKAAQDADPRARFQGNLGRAGAVLGAKVPSVPTETVAEWAGAAIDAAIEAGDGAGALRALALSRAVSSQLGQDAAHAERAAKVRAAVGDGGQGALGAQLIAAHADAAYRVGRLGAVVADQAAAQPMAGPELRGPLALRGGIAAFYLRDGAALAAAAQAAEGPWRAALEALQRAASGDLAAALSGAPRASLPPDLLAEVQLAIARQGGARALSAAERAVGFADQSGEARLIVEARLQLEALLRDVNPAAAAKAVDPLRKVEGAVGLRAELAVRAQLAGLPAAAVEGAPPVWAAVLDGRALEAPAPRWAAVARWHAAMLDPTQEGLEEALRGALVALPLHRVGALSAGTALDGSQGVATPAALAALAALEPKEGAVGAALAVLEAAQRRGLAQDELLVGHDALAGLAPEARRELLEAAAVARAATTAYHLGFGPLPEEAFDTLAALEQAAIKADLGFARSCFGEAPSLADMQVGAPRTALLSFAPVAGKLWGVVWSGGGVGLIKDLGPAGPIFEAGARHRAALAGSNASGQRTPHAAGDRLRAALLDPFAQALAGQGRFVTVLPAGLRDVQLTTLPDNREGLRWLASIRIVGQLDRLSRIKPVVESAEADGDRFTPAYLVLQPKLIPAPVVEVEEAPKAPTPPPAADDEIGFAAEVTAPPPAFVLPADLLAGTHKYDENYSSINAGEQATLAQWTSLMPRAQVIHLTSADSAPGGGIVLHDGVLTMEAVRGSKLTAELVVVAVPGEPEVQAARARAFLDAGALSVLVVGWPIPDASAVPLYEGFFSALMRDRTPVKALGDARDNLLRESPLAEKDDNPGLWGTMVLYGLP